MKLLINTVETLRKVVAVNADLDFSGIEPYLHSAQLFIARFTGEQLISDLADLLASETAFNPQQQALHDRLARPIGNLAVLKFANLRAGQITDVGVMRAGGDTQRDSFEWQLQRVTAGLTKEAWDGIEDLLRFLEKNKADYPAYTDSEPYQEQAESLIRSAQVFSKHYFIADSRLTFWSLQSALSKADRRIRGLLGVNYAPLLTETGLDDTQKARLSAARDALAYLTMARAVRERIVEINDQGVQVNAISNYIQQSKPADQKRLEKLLEHLDSQVLQSIGELVELLPPTSSGPATGGVRGNAIVSF